MKANPTVAHQELKRALSIIDKALVDKNTKALGVALSEDFIGSIPTGEYFSKETYIQHHSVPGMGILSISGEDDENTIVRFYGDTAVINRRVKTLFRIPTGNILEYQVQRTEVLVLEDQQWKMVSGQGTRVIPVNHLADSL